MYFQYWKSNRDGDWYWRLRRRGNNKTIARSSEGYESKQACIESINLVKTYASTATVTEIEVG